MTHDTFERKSFDGTRLYFQNWQPNQDPRGVICLVHGLGEHMGRYAHWADMFNRSNYALIGNDLRGHGKSEGQRGHVISFEEYVKDTDLLIQETEQRYPGVPRFLYGHSLGAIIAILYVLQRKPQLNGAIISALSNRTSLQEQKIKVMLSKILGSIVPKMTIPSGLVPSTISRDPEVVARYTNDPLVHDKVTLGWGNSALHTIEWNEQYASEWVIPVLVMHGELDQLGYPKGSEVFANLIKSDCTLKVWPGLYHELHNEPEKEMVFEFLMNWLEAHRSKTA
jgi:alpha-beta hydrolase superfamily lysophospholipase